MFPYLTMTPLITVNLNNLLPFVQTSGYFILFTIMFFEGPIITYVAAFAASQGYLNGLIIIILSILGNILPDVMYYSIGHSTRKIKLHKYLHRFGLTKSRINLFENGLRTHAGKFMFIVKVVPSLPMVGLTLAGRALPFKKFIFYSALISALYSIFFFILGFYSGRAYGLILNYFNVGESFLILFFVVVIAIWFIFTNWLKRKFKLLK